MMTRAAYLKSDYRKVVAGINITPIWRIVSIWWRFWHVIKMMANVENLLNDDEFFADIIDTPKEGFEQHLKRECLKEAISKEK